MSCWLQELGLNTPVTNYISNVETVQVANKQAATPKIKIKSIAFIEGRVKKEFTQKGIYFS